MGGRRRLTAVTARNGTATAPDGLAALPDRYARLILKAPREPDNEFEYSRIVSGMPIADRRA